MLFTLWLVLTLYLQEVGLTIPLLVYFGVNFTNKAMGRIRSLNNVLTSFLLGQMSFNLCP